MHNFFLVCLLYLSISTRFGRLCAHHQEIQVCLCNTWYSLFCADDCLVCRVEWGRYLVQRAWSRGLSNMSRQIICNQGIYNINIPPCKRESSTQNNKYQVSHKHSCFSWWWAHSRPKHVDIDKYKHTKKMLCTKLVLFTRLYRDAQSIKHKKICSWFLCCLWANDFY